MKGVYLGRKIADCAVHGQASIPERPSRAGWMSYLNTPAVFTRSYYLHLFSTRSSAVNERIVSSLHYFKTPKATVSRRSSEALEVHSLPS